MADKLTKTIPVDRDLKLRVKLDTQFGSSKWKDYSYEYMCCGTQYNTVEYKILKTHGYIRDSAPFIYRIHSVDYGERFVEYCSISEN